MLSFDDSNEDDSFDDSDEDNRGRRGGRSYDSSFTVFFRPSDLFW